MGVGVGAMTTGQMGLHSLNDANTHQQHHELRVHRLPLSSTLASPACPCRTPECRPTAVVRKEAQVWGKGTL